VEPSDTARLTFFEENIHLFVYHSPPAPFNWGLVSGSLYSTLRPVIDKAMKEQEEANVLDN